MRYFVILLLAALPVEAGAQTKQADTRSVGQDTVKPQPFSLPPGGSRSSGRIAVKVSGKDNGGAFAVLEVPTAMGSGPPLHVHHVENEWFYALEGEYDIQVGDQIFHLKPGGSAFGPRMIPHTWHDVGPVPGKMLVVAQPAGHIEAFTEDLEKLVAAGPPSPAAFKALFQKHDMEIVGQPLAKKVVK
jgi:mannose-6-phosphate isomerase-like protein (cupin superfamily)